MRDADVKRLTSVSPFDFYCVSKIVCHACHLYVYFPVFCVSCISWVSSFSTINVQNCFQSGTVAGVLLLL